MSGLSDLMKAVTRSLSSAVAAGVRRGADRADAPSTGGRGGRGSRRRRGTAGSSPAPGSASPDDSPGRSGPDATVEVEPTAVGAVRMAYHPDPDGDPDPGEIVWTWVPFEEKDGRGKDRPVLVVAAETKRPGAGHTVLAVQLTSKDHDGQTDFVAIGAGAWDGEHRPSWVNIDRVMRVHPGGMRREACSLDRENYQRVEAALRSRYGWR